MSEWDEAYFRNRSVHEWQAARKSSNKKVAEIHRRLAQGYAAAAQSAGKAAAKINWSEVVRP